MPDLVGLGLAGDVLEIQQLGHVSVDVDVMASSNSRERETDRFGEPLQIGEPDVLHGAGSDASEEFPRVHVVAAATDAATAARMVR